MRKEQVSVLSFNFYESKQFLPISHKSEEINEEKNLIFCVEGGGENDKQ